MSLKIPTIMSDVGVNNQIIQDGINGFLSTSDDEWFDNISSLIDDKKLREKMGKQGRYSVEKKYSLNANKNTYLSFFDELVNR